MNADGNVVKWTVDPATGRLLKTVSQASGPMPGETVTEYTDWRVFGGLQLPTVTIMSRNGEKSGEVRLTAIEVNPTVDPGAFVKP